MQWVLRSSNKRDELPGSQPSHLRRRFKRGFLARGSSDTSECNEGCCPMIRPMYPIHTQGTLNENAQPLQVAMRTCQDLQAIQASTFCLFPPGMISSKRNLFECSERRISRHLHGTFPCFITTPHALRAAHAKPTLPTDSRRPRVLPRPLKLVAGFFLLLTLACLFCRYE